jgi:hypothetical protein
MYINFYSKAILMLCLSLASPSLFSQEAYKWVDEQGNVHYGDKPPENVSNPVPVAIEPGPSQEKIQEAEEIKEKRIENAETYEANREVREAEKAERLANEQKVNETKQVQNTDSQEENADDSHVVDDHDEVVVGPCDDSRSRNTPCIKRQPINKLPHPVQPIANPPVRINR